MAIVFHIIIPWIAIINAAVVVAIFLRMNRCEQKMRDRFTAAMNFALDLPLYQGRQFMRAYLAGDDVELRVFFPTWKAK